MRYVKRDAEGKVVGTFANPQFGADGALLTDAFPLDDEDPDVVAFLSPSVVQLRATAMAEARAARTLFFARFDGLQASALVNNDAALATEIESVKQAMRDITSIDLSGYTTLDEMRHAFKVGWDEIRAPLSLQLKLAFASLDQ